MLVSWSTSERRVEKAEAATVHLGLATGKGTLGSGRSSTNLGLDIYQIVITCCHLAINCSADSPTLAYILTI